MKISVSSSDLQQRMTHFNPPSYDQIPAIGLFLEQTSEFITASMHPFHSLALTPSMISNYVKNGLIDNPTKKRYSREQIAKLLFIAFAKSVLPLKDLKVALNIQSQTYPTQIAYQYLIQELLNCLNYVVGHTKQLDAIGSEHTDQKKMLRNIILTVAHEIYLTEYFELLRNPNQTSK